MQKLTPREINKLAEAIGDHPKFPDLGVALGYSHAKIRDYKKMNEGGGGEVNASGTRNLLADWFEKTKANSNQFSNLKKALKEAKLGGLGAACLNKKANLSMEAIFELAKAIGDNSKLPALAIELGYGHAEIRDYMKMNSGGGREVNANGTRALLADWYDETSDSENQRISLINALGKAGLSGLFVDLKKDD